MMVLFFSQERATMVPEFESSSEKKDWLAGPSVMAFEERVYSVRNSSWRPSVESSEKKDWSSE